MIVWLIAAIALASPIEVRVRQRGDDKPVPDATLTVDGQPVVLDDKGRATLDLPDGVEASLVVKARDHAGQTLLVTPPQSKVVGIFLKPLAEPGEIVVEAFRPTSDLSRHRVDAEMAYETPGTYDDAVRLVQSLPGVNVQREYAPTSGEVSVRGSRAGDNRYYLDGIEVPYLYHFGQYASVFPASQLDTLDLYSSAFGPHYGDSVGAIIEAVSDTAPPEDVTGSAGINFTMVSGEVRAPLKRGWWVSGSARRSFQDLVTQQTEQFPLWPSFYDFAVRAEKVRDHDTFAVFAAGAGDRYDRVVGELDVLDPVESTSTPRLRYGRDYQLAGFRYDWRGGRLTSAIIHDHTGASVDVGGATEQRLVSFPTRVDMHGQVSDAVSWEAGGEMRSEVGVATLEDAGIYGALVTEEAPSMAWGIDTTATQARTRLAAYGELHAQLGVVRLVPGVRVGLDTASWEPTVEPRFTARFRVADQTELRIGGGRYQQRPETLQLLVDPDLPTTNAWEVAVGLDQTVANRLEFVLEGYAKWLDHVIWQPISGPPRVAETGRSYGAELTIRYRMRETFFLWAWFAAGRSVLDEGEGPFPSSADQPLSGGLVVSWNIVPALNAAMRYRISSGLPFTDIDGSTYDATGDTWIPVFAAPNAERLPLYQKIDIHVAYTFQLPRWSLTIAADVWIVPKSSAQLYPTWNYDYSERGFVIGPTVLPLLGVRATF